MWSRRVSPSTMVLWVNKPLVAISSCRANSLLIPNQKCYKSTWLGIDKSGPNLVKIENLSQVASMVSFSLCWKLSISCHRASVWDIGKNTRQNMFLSSSESPATFSTLWAYHCFGISFSEKGNSFHLSVSCDMP